MRDTKSSIFKFKSTKYDIAKFAKLLNNLDPNSSWYGQMSAQEIEDTANELSLFWSQLQRYWNQQNPNDKI